MFEMPSKERLDEIMKEVPDVVNVFSRDKGSYLMKCKYAMWLNMIVKELGVNVPMPFELSEEYVKNFFLANRLPDFAVLENANGRYFISFGDDDEKDPIIALTRDYYEECTNAYIYSFSETVLSNMAFKRIRRCAIHWCKNLITKDIVVIG